MACDVGASRQVVGGMRLQHPLGPGTWRISQRFGESPAFYAQFGLPGHPALDFAAPAGAPVYAAHDGLATRTWNSVYGNRVLIRSTEMETHYSHLSLIVAVGSVHAGDLIGYVGKTGNATGFCLDFEIIPLPADIDSAYGGRVDPEPFLRAEWLPEDETSTDPVVLRQKHIWWTEEAIRQFDAHNEAYGGRILRSLVTLLQRG